MTRRPSKASAAILAALVPGDEREYWDIVNFVAFDHRAGALATVNVQRALDALIRRGVVTVDDSGYCTVKAV